MPEQRTLSFQNKSMTYYCGGEGRAILFLHGFCEDHTIWDSFIAPFQHYKIIVPDLPGFGNSPPTDEPVTIAAMANLVKKILDEEQVKSCCLIGHSMGGYVAVNFASRYAERLDGLALFHSTAYADDEAKKADRKRVADLVLKNGYEKFASDLHDVLFSDSFKEKKPHIVAEMKNYSVKHFTREGVAAASLAMGNRDDTSEFLKSFPRPVLFIVGKKDKAVPPEKTLPLVHFPNTSVIQILEDAAHMGMLEQPELTQQSVQAFLDLLETVQ